MMSGTVNLLLHTQHEDRGAVFGPFSGFNMPLYYSKPLQEHHQVRNEAGVFDISHMGQFVAEGKRIQDFLQYALTNDLSPLVDGQALYSPLCREDGGVLDDIIVYRYAADRYRIIVNAGNRERDFAWLQGLAASFAVELRDLSAEYALFAVQGPQALALLKGHVEGVERLAYYHFCEGEGFEAPLFVARTGYTGEPGCEIAVQNAYAPRLWAALTETLGIVPIGLVARDTLRMEAAMPLYGHELREDWHPLESGVAWAVRLEGEDFMGKAALLAAKESGYAYRLVGLELTERGVPRGGYPVSDGERSIGEITSGGISPTTGKALALAHVEKSHARAGSALFVEIRGKQVAAQTVLRPFYQNPAVRAAP